MAGQRVVEIERDTYERMWGMEAYAADSPGARVLPVFLDMIERLVGGDYVGDAVLDAGCGSGKGALALSAAGFDVTMCDLTPAGLVPEAAALPFHQIALWDDVGRVTGRHDYVFCCDVMEHVPPAFTMLVAHQLLTVARKGVFFSIALLPDTFGAWVGKPLHQSVQSFAQWRDQLDTVGEVLEARDLLLNGVYFVRARS